MRITPTADHGPPRSGMAHDDAVGHQAATFFPELLLVFGLQPWFPIVGIGDGSA